MLRRTAVRSVGTAAAGGRSKALSCGVANPSVIERKSVIPDCRSRSWSAQTRMLHDVQQAFTQNTVFWYRILCRREARPILCLLLPLLRTSPGRFNAPPTPLQPTRLLPFQFPALIHTLRFSLPRASYQKRASGPCCMHVCRARAQSCMEGVTKTTKPRSYRHSSRTCSRA